MGSRSTTTCLLQGANPFLRVLSFPRSAWERTSGRSASRAGALRTLVRGSQARRRASRAGRSHAERGDESPVYCAQTGLHPLLHTARALENATSDVGFCE